MAVNAKETKAAVKPAVTKAPVDKSVDQAAAAIKRVKVAQKIYADYPQEEVDAIFKAAALAADEAAVKLAKAAFEETGMGNLEDKVIKNRYAAEFTYSQYKDTPTCGVVERNDAQGTLKLAEPLGVLGAIVPCTNPTSTAIFNALLALKTRNGIVFSPHPRSAKATIAAAKVVLDAAVAAGAPKDIIGWVEEPTIASSEALMKEADVILATGGPGMVKAAYSSGKPAIGVGPGNVPVLVDSSADLDRAASAIIHSKSFDNGVICASEQNVCVVKDAYDGFLADLKKRGAYLLPASEKEKLAKVIMRTNPKTNVCSANPLIVGKSPFDIGKIAGIAVPENARIIVVEAPKADPGDPFCHEKLSPVLTVIKVDSFEEGIDACELLCEHGGHGHTADLYVSPLAQAKVEKFASALETCRILINTPSSQGGIGGIYTNGIRPSLTLGCGSWGGNSTWENVGVDNLLNYKVVGQFSNVKPAFIKPAYLFTKKNALRTGLAEILKACPTGKLVLVYDENGIKAEAEVASRLNKAKRKFVEVEVRDYSRRSAHKVAIALKKTGAKGLVAIGGDIAVAAGKLGRLLSVSPRIDLDALALPFLSLSKRIASVPVSDVVLSVIETSAWVRDGVSQRLTFEREDGTVGHVYDPSLVPTIAIIDKDWIVSHADDDSLRAYAALGRLLSSYTALGAGKEVDSLTIKSLKAARKVFKKNKLTKGAAIEFGLASALCFSNTCGGFSDALARGVSLAYGVDIDGALSVLLPSSIAQVITDAPYKIGTASGYVVPLGKAKFVKAAKKLKLAGKTDDELIASLTRWITEIRVKLHLPTAFADLAITPAVFKRKLDAAVELAFSSQSILTACSYPRIEGLTELLFNLL